MSNTKEWQQQDASHHLHPFTHFQALNQKGSRIITGDIVLCV